MEHIIRRCKNCNKEYIYCTYGNGPDWGTEEGCSMEYCRECQKAINDALAKIPEKYSWKMELVQDKDFDYINKMIDFEKEKHRKEITNGVRFEMSKLSFTRDYKELEGCYINHIYYIRGIKENDDVEIKESVEFDTINKKLTGKRYRFYDHPRNQYVPITIFNLTKKDGIPEKELEKPIGKVFFDEFELEYNNESDDNEKLNID